MACLIVLLQWTACEGTKSEAHYTHESIVVEDISDYLQTFLYPDLRILYGLLTYSQGLEQLGGGDRGELEDDGTVG